MTVRVGLLVGRETGFPQALIERINGHEAAVQAEMIRLHGTHLDERIPYGVIIDRLSHEVPYYRAYCKKAVADGCILINNPFWWSADDKFFECVLAEKLGVAVPKTVVLPSMAHEADLIDASLRNLEPIDWDEIIAYVGLPAVLKPAVGGGWKNVSVVRSQNELLEAYGESGSLLMILQEFIDFENYSRCFVIGRKHVRVARYDPHQTHFERFVVGDTGLSAELHDRIVNDCLKLNRALGYDMNTVEFAIRGGIPYAIDFFNPAPDFEQSSIRPDNFEWVVERLTDLVVDYALRPQSQTQLPIWADEEADRLGWLAMIGDIPALHKE